MLNQDKYKTPEERNHAFNEWCFNRECESCKLKAHNFDGGDGCRFYWLALEAEEEKKVTDCNRLGNAAKMREALVAMVEAETDGTMERDYLCGRCLERLFDRCKHDGSCWVDKVMNALAEAKGEAK